MFLWKLVKKLVPHKVKHRIRSASRRWLLGEDMNDAVHVLQQQFHRLESGLFRALELQESLWQAQAQALEGLRAELYGGMTNQESLWQAQAQALEGLRAELYKGMTNQSLLWESNNQGLQGLKSELTKGLQMQTNLWDSHNQAIETINKNAAYCLKTIDSVVEQLEKADPTTVLSHTEYLEFEKQVLAGRFEKEHVYFEELKRFIEPGSRILDVGCGDGRFLKFMVQSGYAALGIDENPDMVSSSCDKGVEAIIGRAPEKMGPMKDCSYDAVVSLHVVEHMSYADLRGTLEEAYRILRPGGVVLLETPNTQSLHSLTHYYFMDPTHLMPRHPDLYRFLMEQTGFSDVVIDQVFRFVEEENIEPIDNQGSDDAIKINKNFEIIKNEIYGGGNILLRGIKRDEQ